MLSLQRLFFFIVGVGLVVNLVFWTWRPNITVLINSKNPSLQQLKQNKCVLPNLDPWAFSIKEYLNPSNNPLEDCKVTFEKRSFIDSSGFLIVSKSKNATQNCSDDDSELTTEDCNYRCLDTNDGSNLIYGNLSEVSKENKTNPGCEIFEVQCFKDSIETYKYLHGQIIPKDDLSSKPSTKLPDMHIILVDSTSMSHFFRAMPLTTNYLRTDMDALVFKYLNKVGLNSRPNAYSLLFGEQAESLKISPWGPKKTFFGRNKELCSKYLDNENFIFYDYKAQGYYSMWNEDWSDAVIRWPNCKGFKERPVDHYMQAYALRFEQNKTKMLKKNLFKNSCRESHNFLLDILKEFIEKYKNTPKVSISWLTNIAHNQANHLYHADSHFRDFFVEMKSKLSNSFVFFLADHGNRYLLPTNQLIGEVEISNPFFVLIVPEKLRKNKDLIEQLQRNSNELISHHDVYATFLEIATNGGEWDENTHFSDHKYSHWNRTLFGSSLLHPLDQPRTCERLKIPHQYCICQNEYKEFQDEEISLKIADAVVKKMNIDIKNSKFADKCATLHVNRTETAKLALREYESQGNRRIFRSSLITLPSGGEHDTFAEYVNGAVSLISTQFARNNEYKEQAHCIPEHFMRNYCYCNDLLK